MNIFFGLVVGLLLATGKFICFCGIGSADAYIGYPLGSFAAGGIHRLGSLKTHYGLAKLGLLKMGHIGFKKYGLLGAANPNSGDDSEENSSDDENMFEEGSPEVGAHMWTVPRSSPAARSPYVESGHIHSYEVHSPVYEENLQYREVNMEPEMSSYYDDSQYRSNVHKAPTYKLPPSYGRKPHYSKGREMEHEQPYMQHWDHGYNYDGNDAVLGEMGPQIPENARTLYPGNLFGLMMDGLQHHTSNGGERSGGYGYGGQREYRNHGNYRGHGAYSGHDSYSGY